jgi:drug/metabolite transporter (DMT)-like permease
MVYESRSGGWTLLRIGQHCVVIVLLGSLAAIFFGVGDLLGGVAIRRSGRPGSAISIAMTATAVSAVLTGVVVLVYPPEAVSAGDVVWSVSAGLLMAVTRPLLYSGMARGPVAVFAPGYGLTMIAVPALLGPFIGQSLGSVAIWGVLMAIPAVVLLSGEGRLPRPAEVVRSRILGRAVLVGVSLGSAGLCFSQVSEEAGVLSAFLALTVGLVVLPVASHIQTGSVWPGRRDLSGGAIVGITSAVAFMLSTAAYQMGSAAVVSALVALSPAVSITLSWRFLGERVARLQVLGGAFGAAAIVFLTIGT